MSISRLYFPHDEERARDLASETVLKAIEARDRFDQNKPMLPWCRAIMRNIFLLICSKDKMINADVDPEGGIEADQRTLLLQTLSVIRRLRWKSVCVDTLLDYAMGYSAVEIARAKRLPLSTVKRRVHDARILLRRLII